MIWIGIEIHGSSSDHAATCCNYPSFVLRWHAAAAATISLAVELCHLLLIGIILNHKVISRSPKVYKALLILLHQRLTVIRWD